VEQDVEILPQKSMFVRSACAVLHDSVPIARGPELAQPVAGDAKGLQLPPDSSLNYR